MGKRMEGFLQKMGDKGVVKSWKNRWFTLDGNVISYFKQPEDAVPISFFLLQIVTSAYPAAASSQDSSHHKGFVFYLDTTEGRTFILSASSDEERGKWISAILGNMEEASLPIAAPRYPMGKKNSNNNNNNNSSSSGKKGTKAGQDNNGTDTSSSPSSSSSLDGLSLAVPSTATNTSTTTTTGRTRSNSRQQRHAIAFSKEEFNKVLVEASSSSSSSSSSTLSTLPPTSSSSSSSDVLSTSPTASSSSSSSSSAVTNPFTSKPAAGQEGKPRFAIGGNRKPAATVSTVPTPSTPSADTTSSSSSSSSSPDNNSNNNSDGSSTRKVMAGSARSFIKSVQRAVSPPPPSTKPSSPPSATSSSSSSSSDDKGKNDEDDDSNPFLDKTTPTPSSKFIRTRPQSMSPNVMHSQLDTASLPDIPADVPSKSGTAQPDSATVDDDEQQSPPSIHLDLATTDPDMDAQDDTTQQQQNRPRSSKRGQIRPRRTESLLNIPESIILSTETSPAISPRDGTISLSPSPPSSARGGGGSSSNGGSALGSLSEHLDHLSNPDQYDVSPPSSLEPSPLLSSASSSSLSSNPFEDSSSSPSSANTNDLAKDNTTTTTTTGKANRKARRKNRSSSSAPFNLNLPHVPEEEDSSAPPAHNSDGDDGNNSNNNNNYNNDNNGGKDEEHAKTTDHPHPSSSVSPPVGDNGGDDASGTSSTGSKEEEEDDESNPFSEKTKSSSLSTKDNSNDDENGDDANIPFGSPDTSYTRKKIVFTRPGSIALSKAGSQTLQQNIIRENEKQQQQQSTQQTTTTTTPTPNTTNTNTNTNTATTATTTSTTAQWRPNAPRNNIISSYNNSSTAFSLSRSQNNGRAGMEWASVVGREMVHKDGYLAVTAPSQLHTIIGRTLAKTNQQQQQQQQQGGSDQQTPPPSSSSSSSSPHQLPPFAGVQLGPFIVDWKGDKWELNPRGNTEVGLRSPSKEEVLADLQIQKRAAVEEQDFMLASFLREKEIAVESEVEERFILVGGIVFGYRNQKWELVESPFMSPTIQSPLLASSSSSLVPSLSSSSSSLTYSPSPSLSSSTTLPSTSSLSRSTSSSSLSMSSSSILVSGAPITDAIQNTFSSFFGGGGDGSAYPGVGAGAGAHHAGGGGASEPEMTPAMIDILTLLDLAVKELVAHVDKILKSPPPVSFNISGKVRGPFCTAMASVFGLGFQSSGLFRKHHYWDFIQSCGDYPSHNSVAALSMCRSIKNINSSEQDHPCWKDPNMKFRTFICSALNNGQLREWLHLLATNTNASSKYFDDSSFMRHPTAYRKIMACLAPLAPPTFPLLQLPLDYEARPFERDGQDYSSSRDGQASSSLSGSLAFVSSLKSSVSNLTQQASDGPVGGFFKGWM